MKTKAEIKEKIKQIRINRDDSKYIPNRKYYVLALNMAIYGLEWAMGYKVPKTYWCSACALPHRNIRCPICGNATVREQK